MTATENASHARARFLLFALKLGNRKLKHRHERLAGKVREVFDRVSKLPRRQQEKILEVVSALMSQYEQSRQ